MGISETQLSTWSGLGAQQGSASTYQSIKSALNAHSWPQGMDHEVYLQGSYPNHTNIRGDSDVDVVVETSNVFYNDAQSHLQSQLGLTGGAAYAFDEFRAEVKKALVNYYGSRAVADGDKCLKVSGNSSRLDADVVPCVRFRHYQNTVVASKGITFWTLSRIQVVNYPKVHLDNGSAKNLQCASNYKPNVRVFKNARNRAGNDFPSYFLECMLYNVPNNCYSNSFRTTFLDTLSYLENAKNNGVLASFHCQNEQQLIFGSELHQVDLVSGESLIHDLVVLWNNA